MAGALITSTSAWHSQHLHVRRAASGFRQATARMRRTKADWAIEAAQMLDTRDADRAGVTLVCDNLNTHTKGAFYEAFDRTGASICETDQLLLHSETRKLAEYRRVRVELLDGQCLSDRRIGELTDLQFEIAAWSDKTNAKQRGVDWQFCIEDARMKLSGSTPKLRLEGALARSSPGCG